MNKSKTIDPNLNNNKILDYLLFNEITNNETKVETENNDEEKAIQKMKSIASHRHRK